MLSTLLLASASASFAVTASVYTSEDGGCGGDRVLHIALEADVCALAPDLCQFAPSCSDLETMIPQLGDCFALSSITDMFPSEESRRLPSAQAAVVKQIQSFLADVVVPMARRRQTIPDLSGGLPDMDSLPFGDIMLTCGGASIGTMSAGAGAGITIAVFLIVVALAGGVIYYSYKVKGFRVVQPQAEVNQGIEMNDTNSATPKGQWQTDVQTPKGEGETEQV